MFQSESFRARSMELPNEPLTGAIDTHVHAGPVLGSNSGHADPIEIALEARAMGMRGVVYYDVFGGSSGISWLVNRHVPGIETFGAYLMNSGHGGLNPRAVRTALNIEGGCRMISFGSHCTYFQASHESTMIDGKAVPLHQAYPKFAEQELSRAVRIPLSGPVPDDIAEIMEMIAERPEVYLNTGHVSHDEVFRVVELAERFGVAKVLVSHPARGQLSVAEQKQLAAKGVFMEGCLVDIFATGAPLTHYYAEAEYIDRGWAEQPHTVAPVSDYMNTLREIGTENVVLGTDYGVRALPSAVQGMRTWATLLLDFEFSIEQIRQMIAHNPARLLGLPELDDAALVPKASRKPLYPETD
ncbi:DUF6282 family protein [Glycomyces buryatensis]|uniref:Amidohydrolase-related domain-containing protein n=1 Tax=Glycomyces buryatensis TaxID=2570927 RepID=A0A4S8QBH7_9ACTN|nr:DUF6282 family protein [Glycomyces buryatensis]THV41847.1 hypothetical protein FAB82_08990 [Glycomyces buryatensis]